MGYREELIEEIELLRAQLQPEWVGRLPLIVSESVDSGMLLPSKSSSTLSKSIQIENVHRLFGPTVFPLRDESLLGLRFDLFNENLRGYVLPHYIILKRIVNVIEKTGQRQAHWTIFKSTIPTYLGVESLFNKWVNVREDLGVDSIKKFASEMYNILVSNEMKRSELGALQRLISNKYKELVLIKSDLHIGKITLIIKKIEIILIIDNEKVVQSIIVGQFKQQAIISELLNETPVNKLSEMLDKVISMIL
ncbi:hypothetical protein DAMA08_000180 [Martiniozyma asiatica (nom. inval.)]|nr:hypothetical protein DAMA08_000180 [Martiniozyma asiatica]